MLTSSAATTMVGNWANVVSGTNFTTGLFQITAVSAGTSITFATNAASASICTGVGASGVINIGGARATVNGILASGQLVAGMSIYAKGSESRSSILTTLATGIRLIGYTSTRGDGGKYTFQASAGMGTMLTITGGGLLENIKLDYNSQTITAGLFVASTAAIQIRNLEITGAAGSIGSSLVNILGDARGLYIHDNSITTTTGALTGGVSVKALEIYNNANVAFSVSSGGSTMEIDGFIIANNGGDGIRIGTGTAPLQASNGVIHAAGTNGINNTASAASIPGAAFDNVIISSSTSKAIAMTNATTQKFKVRLKNVFEYNSGSASTGNFEGTLGSLGADPFTSASGGDFSLNKSSAAYASLKAVGFTYPRGTTVDKGDIGAAQHLEVVGGGHLVNGGLVS